MKEKEMVGWRLRHGQKGHFTTMVWLELWMKNVIQGL